MPILVLQFIVEVDSSEVGVGDVLSQHFPEDNKVHLFISFSKKLSSVECNSDVEHQGLLAIKLASEE